MDKLIEILEDINPDNDYMKEDKLIDGGLLDSLFHPRACLHA